MTDDEFLDEVVYPALNENPNVIGVDVVLTSDSGITLDIILADGDHWTMRVYRDGAMT